jgi:hypothetical protein
MKQDRNSVYLELRKKYPLFVYDSFELETDATSLRATFHFKVPPDIEFHPQFEIPAKGFIRFDRIGKEALEDLVFHVGLAETISYWKACCSPTLLVKGRKLDAWQVEWWKKLYYHGLGEFFYLNGIEPDRDTFLTIESDSQRATQPFETKVSNMVLIPIGGGKDSVVSLEILKGLYPASRPMIMNPRGATIKTAETAGFGIAELLVIKRNIHPRLLELNDAGYLNGHTPFSALLAFSGILAACLCGAQKIALSNESSADESTVVGTGINHQYSKSFEFESDFREYSKRYLCQKPEYFSFLRPLLELQIAELFSRFPEYADVFKSCNAGSKTDSWCGKCAKCLFTYIILSPFISASRLRDIYGHDLLNDPGLISVFDELTGKAPVKPFECIGTIREVNVALCMSIEQRKNEELPLLLKTYRNSELFEKYRNVSPEPMLKTLSDQHFLSPEELALLTQKLHDRIS